jgi:hypothetical protein
VIAGLLKRTHLYTGGKRRAASSLLVALFVIFKVSVASDAVSIFLLIVRHVLIELEIIILRLV